MLIQGGPGDPLPLFLDQTEVRRAEKSFLETVPVPPLFKGVDDLPPLPPLSQGLDPALYSSTKTGEKENFLTVLGRSKFKFKSNLR